MGRVTQAPTRTRWVGGVGEHRRDAVCGRTLAAPLAFEYLLAMVVRGSGPDPDDWFAQTDMLPVRPPRVAPRLRGADRRPLALAAAAGLVVVLLVALAIAGVFSSSSHPPASTITTSTTTAATVPAVHTPSTPAPAALQPPTSTLKPGARGAQVRALQRSLIQLGYQVGKVDGRYGPKTATALQAFQASAGLKTDGVFGPKTLAALKRALRRHSAAASGSR